jgi:hypothetical protein
MDRGRAGTMPILQPISIIAKMYLQELLPMYLIGKLPMLQNVKIMGTDLVVLLYQKDRL